MSSIPDYVELHQVAAYWAPTGNDDYGRPTWGTVVQINCRWEDKATLYVDAKGREFVSRAIVYVDTDVAPMGVLSLGPVSQLSDPINPFANPNTWEVKKYERIPEIDNAQKFLKAAIV
jgi:hypothetical protein